MHFKDDEEVTELVRAFETCEIHPADFKHYQHLAVAVWYLKHFPYEDASAKMRLGIQRLAAAYGKMGYHETITLFWLKMVWRFVANEGAGQAIFSLANNVGNEYDKNLIADYYAEETLVSPKAKSEWVEPDLKRLEFEQVDGSLVEA